MKPEVFAQLCEDMAMGMGQTISCGEYCRLYGVWHGYQDRAVHVGDPSEECEYYCRGARVGRVIRDG